MFLLPGILPLIFWAFGRFRANKAAGPLFAWGAIGIAFVVLIAIGEFTDTKVTLRNISTNASSLLLALGR